MIPKAGCHLSCSKWQRRQLIPIKVPRRETWSKRHMLKSILVLLGETLASAAARRYAFRLAERTNADVSGLAGIDLSYIEAPMAGSLGGSAYKPWLEDRLHKQADKVRRRLHEQFELECKEHCVAFSWLAFEGDPISSIQAASETRDLVVTGHDTTFRGNVREQLSEILSVMLVHTPRPVVICPDELSESEDILVAYDGSLCAMRTLQLFALMDIGSDKRVCVTSIDADRDSASRHTTAAVGYLRSHGYVAESNPIVSRTHPAEVLRIEVSDRKIGTLVMGAYGHRGFREFLFGSTTQSLVENPPAALFVYH